MLFQAFVPNQKPRNDGRARPQGEQCDRWCRCGWNSEEFRKDSFAACGVLIKKNPNSLIPPKGSEDIAGCAASLDRNVAARGAVARNQILDARIIDRSNEKLKGIS